MEPWYKVATPRKEVREGRSFNPDEFAIALEQVVAGTAPEDYRDPAQFFARTCFTRALREHAGMVLRRLSGQNRQHRAGADAHHPVRRRQDAHADHALPPGDERRRRGRLHRRGRPGARSGRRVRARRRRSPCSWATPGTRSRGARRRGSTSPASSRVTRASRRSVRRRKTTPPGTEAIARVFQAAGAPVLLLFDEVLNFLNRHRGMAESFHAFIQNLTVATTGTTHGAAVISLPRSQVEMTDWDHGVAGQDLEGRAARRQGPDRQRRDRDQRGRPAAALRGPGQREDPEERRQGLRRLVLRAAGAASAGVDGGGLGRDRGQGARVPAAPLRGLLPVPSGDALGLPAQVAGAAAVPADARHAGDAGPVDLDRRAGRLPQGAHRAADHARLGAARGARIPQRRAGAARRVAPRRRDRHGHRRRAGARKALDADTKGPLRDIHRRVGTAILFESSGGQTDKVAHLPELRFALGEPELDTTSIDNAAFALEGRSYFVRKAGSDGFRIGYQPTMKKVVSDRRASLDEETEVKPAMRKLVEEEFRRGASIPVVPFPRDGAEIPDTPRLTLVVADPEVEWSGGGSLRAQLAEWTRQRGKSPRLYPGALVWCLKKPGRDLRDKVELGLAWKRVAREVAEGTLGGEFDKSDRAELQSKVKDAEEAAKDEVWGDYRFAVVADGQEPDGLKVIDLGAGHSSSGETLCGRVIAALKSEALLNESVGAGYIERNWPPALKESGAWPLASLRQSFLNGSLTRLVDPDAILKSKIVEFVSRGDFGLASGQKPDGSYERVWFEELVAPDEVAFDAGVFLLRKDAAKALKAGAPPEPAPGPSPQPGPRAHPRP